MEKYRKKLMFSLKIGIASSIALFLAEYWGLDYSVSAGTITLLTLMTSKCQTLQLSVCRLASFTMTVIAAWMIFSNVDSVWISYGLLLIITVFIAELFEWRATISVNAVISAHLMMNRDFSDIAIWNEFLLVVIGIAFAVVFNLFHISASEKKQIVLNMKSVEKRLQMIIGTLAAYLTNREMERNVWEDICQLEKDIQNNIKEVYEYQSNTFQSCSDYYISFFEMRYNQCQVLHNLHYEMKKIRKMPEQAKVVADYMIYLMEYVEEMNYPQKQIIELEKLAEQIKQDELPKSRDELENRAILYHILMDIEEFLKFKLRFVELVRTLN